MATGINIDPSISLGIKPPAAMSLSEMLNIARGAQLYQTERQLQPEQIRQAQLLTQTQTALQPEQIQQAQIATRTAGSQEKTAGIGAQSAQFSFDKAKTDALNGIIGGYRNDPRIASGDPDQAVDAVNEIKTRARALGIPPSVLERISAQAMGIALEQPKALAQYFDNVIQSQLGAQGQQALQTPQIVTIGEQPGVFRPATQTVTPITYGAPPPQGGAQPAVGVTGADMTAPIGQTVKQDRPALLYPVPQAGSPRPILPQEEFDREAGSTFRNNVINQQMQLSEGRRNIQEVISTAKKLDERLIASPGSAAGAFERQLRTQLGDTDFQKLAKDLANVQLSAMQAMGQSTATDAGKALVREATGDITYSPQILIDIARRANASITELDLMANGLQKHSQLYGDANTKRYQQMWATNSDKRIFELMNVAREIKDPKLQLEHRNKLFKDLSDDQLAEILKKYQNLLKLSKTGDL
jgi:hypothetical protein